MFLRNKLVPVALGAALLGGGVGAFVMRPSSETTRTAAAVSTAPAAAPANRTASALPAQTLVASAQETAATQVPVADVNSANSAENECFREGFAEGVRAAREQGLTNANAAA